MKLELYNTTTALKIRLKFTVATNQDFHFSLEIDDNDDDDFQSPLIKTNNPSFWRTITKNYILNLTSTMRRSTYKGQLFKKTLEKFNQPHGKQAGYYYGAQKKAGTHYLWVID